MVLEYMSWWRIDIIFPLSSIRGRWKEEKKDRHDKARTLQKCKNRHRKSSTRPPSFTERVKITLVAKKSPRRKKTRPKHYCASNPTWSDRQSLWSIEIMLHTVASHILSTYALFILLRHHLYLSSSLFSTLLLWILSLCVQIEFVESQYNFKLYTVTNHRTPTYHNHTCKIVYNTVIGEL